MITLLMIVAFISAPAGVPFAVLELDAMRAWSTEKDRLHQAVLTETHAATARREALHRFLPCPVQPRTVRKG